MICLACFGCNGGGEPAAEAAPEIPDQGIDVGASLPFISNGGPGDISAVSDHKSNGFELLGIFQQTYPIVSLEMTQLKGIYVGQSQPMMDVNFSFSSPDTWEFPMDDAGRPFFRLTAADGSTVDIGAFRRRGNGIGAQLLVGLTQPFEESTMALMSNGEELASWEFENVPVSPEDLPIDLTPQPVEAGQFSVTADPVMKMERLASGREVWSFSPNLKVGGIDSQSETHVAMAWGLVGTDQAPGWYVDSAGSIPISRNGQVDSTLGMVHGGLPEIAVLRGVVQESIYAELTESLRGLSWRQEDGELYVSTAAPQVLELEARRFEIGQFDELVTPDRYVEDVWRIKIPALVIDPRLVDSADEWSRISFDTSHLPGKWRAWMDSMEHGIMDIEVDSVGYQHLLTEPESIEFVIRIHRATQEYPFRLTRPIRTE